MIGNAKACINFLLDKTADLDKKYEVKEYRPKRSLSQNSYAWELIGKIADCLRQSKEEIYLHMLQHYGQSEIFSIRSDIDIKGYFKYYSVFGTGKVNNTEFTHYKIYKGSSEYDSREMSIFIDGIIQEAQNLHIETLTPAQIVELKSLEEQRFLKKVKKN